MINANLPVMSSMAHDEATKMMVTSYPGASTQDSCDGELTDEIAQALEATGYLRLCGVRIQAQDGVVVLHGQVPSHYLKQIAQSAAMAVAGVRQLQNEIAVTRVYP
jgi:osmotically-inducible protein OsmY